jgi:hypothetical protein
MARSGVERQRARIAKPIREHPSVVARASRSVRRQSRSARQEEPPWRLHGAAFASPRGSGALTPPTRRLLLALSGRPRPVWELHEGGRGRPALPRCFPEPRTGPEHGPHPTPARVSGRFGQGQLVVPTQLSGVFPVIETLLPAANVTVPLSFEIPPLALAVLPVIETVLPTSNVTVPTRLKIPPPSSVALLSVIETLLPAAKVTVPRSLKIPPPSLAALLVIETRPSKIHRSTVVQDTAAVAFVVLAVGDLDARDGQAPGLFGPMTKPLPAPAGEPASRMVPSLPSPTPWMTTVPLTKTLAVG